MDWKELKDDSLRVEHHFISPKQSQRQILVGKMALILGKIGPSGKMCFHVRMSNCILMRSGLSKWCFDEKWFVKMVF
jgi:GTPase Era involved in 16S rRNA processing